MGLVKAYIWIVLKCQIRFYLLGDTNWRYFPIMPWIFVLSLSLGEEFVVSHSQLLRWNESPRNVLCFGIPQYFWHVKCFERNSLYKLDVWAKQKLELWCNSFLTHVFLLLEWHCSCFSLMYWTTFLHIPFFRWVPLHSLVMKAPLLPLEKR